MALYSYGRRTVVAAAAPARRRVASLLRAMHPHDPTQPAAPRHALHDPDPRGTQLGRHGVAAAYIVMARYSYGPI